MDEVTDRFPKFGVVTVLRHIMRYLPFFGTEPDCGPLNAKLVLWLNKCNSVSDFNAVDSRSSQLV